MNKPEAIIAAALLSIISYLLPVVSAAQTDQPKSPEELLADLRGLHLPAEPHWFPPAPGWWLLTAIFFLLLWWLVRFFKPRHRKRSDDWRQSALLQYEQLQIELDNGGAHNEVLAQASVLMRRVALVCAPDSQSAAIQNDQWLSLLDKVGKTDQYSQGAGRLLLSHPYRRESNIERSEISELLQLMRATIIDAEVVAGV